MPTFTFDPAETPVVNTNALYGLSNTPPSGSGGFFGASNNPCSGASSQPLSPALSNPSPSFGPFGKLCSSPFEISPRLTPSIFGAPTCPYGTMPTYATFGSAETLPLGNTSAPIGVPSASTSGSGGLLSASSNPCSGASSQPLSCASSTPSMSFGPSAFDDSNFSLFQSSLRPTPSTFGAPHCPFGTMPTSTTFGYAETLPLGNTSAPFSVPNAIPSGSGGLFSAPSNACSGALGQPLSCASSTPSMSFGPSSAFGNLNSSSYQSSLRPNPSTFGAPTCPFGSMPTFKTFGSAATLPHGNTSTALFGVSNAPPSGPGGLFSASSNPCSRASSQPLSRASSSTSLSFGPSSTFGKSNCGPFESSSRPTPSIFGAPTCPFGAAPSFSWPSSTSAFGPVTTPTLVGTSVPFGGVSRVSLSGPPNTLAFGPAITSALGNSGTPFGGSSAISNSSSISCDLSGIPSLGVGCIPAFGQSGSSLGGSAIETTPSLFSSPSVDTTHNLSNTGSGQSGCNGLYWGSKLGAYTQTVEYEGGNSTHAFSKLQSISAMPVYTGKSHEELRWEDYRMRGYQVAYLSGERVPFLSGNHVPSVDFCSCPTVCIERTSGGQHKGSRVAGYTRTDEAGGELEAISGMHVYMHKSHEELRWEDFQLGDKGTTASFASTQPTSVFQSTTPLHERSTSATEKISTPFPFQPNVFSIPSTGVEGNMLSSISIPTQPSQTSNTSSGYLAQTQAGVLNIFMHALNLQPAPQAETSGTSSSANLCQTGSGTVKIFTSTVNVQPLEALSQASDGFGGLMSQGTVGRMSNSQSPLITQAVPSTNPFGILPSLQQIPNTSSRPVPTSHHGIYRMLVTDKAASQVLHGSRPSTRVYPTKSDNSKVWPSTRVYPTKSDNSKVPFSPHDEALGVPEYNWPSSSAKETVLLKDTRICPNENETEQEANGIHDNECYKKAEPPGTPVEKSVGDISIAIQMPKLSLADYYTEPQIQDLAAKERAEPGFCRHVKDFVVGRQGYGSIKFIGETDIVGLDLESLVRFNERELVIYKNDSKKSLPGPGLNRPVEVILENVRCFDKKRGREYTEGPKVEMYKKLLVKKAEDQGGEFVSYDPVKGEWKFRMELPLFAD